MAMVMRARRPVTSLYKTGVETARDWLLPSRTMTRRWWPPVVGLLYIALIGVLGGLHGGHVLIGLLGFLDVYNEKTRLYPAHVPPVHRHRRALRLPALHLVPGTAGRVHVAEPYLARSRLVRHRRDDAGTRSSPSTTGRSPTSPPDSPTSSTSPSTWRSLMLVFVFGNARRALSFARAFFVVNVMGFVTYFIYPAAPPWYVTAHGLGPAQMNITPSPGAASRFDALLGTHIFDQRVRPGRRGVRRDPVAPRRLSVHGGAPRRSRPARCAGRAGRPSRSRRSCASARCISSTITSSTC